MFIARLQLLVGSLHLLNQPKISKNILIQIMLEDFRFYILQTLKSYSKYIKSNANEHYGYRHSLQPDRNAFDVPINYQIGRNRTSCLSQFLDFVQVCAHCKSINSLNLAPLFFAIFCCCVGQSICQLQSSKFRKMNREKMKEPNSNRIGIGTQK